MQALLAYEAKSIAVNCRILPCMHNAHIAYIAIWNRQNHNIDCWIFCRAVNLFAKHNIECNFIRIDFTCSQTYVAIGGRHWRGQEFYNFFFFFQFLHEANPILNKTKSFTLSTVEIHTLAVSIYRGSFIQIRFVFCLIFGPLENSTSFIIIQFLTLDWIFCNHWRWLEDERSARNKQTKKMQKKKIYDWLNIEHQLT